MGQLIPILFIGDAALVSSHIPGRTKCTVFVVPSSPPFLPGSGRACFTFEMELE